jgi:pimeloyl-ACP methyl ester carboxylesterase
MRVLVMLLIAGCAIDAAGDEPIARHRGDPLAWGPCPTDSKYVYEPTAQCATIEVPLDRAHPERGTIPQFIARLPASSGPATKQFWILDGGPGSSGEELFEGIIDWYAQAMPDVDLYVPAHRGTGRSAGLACAGEGQDTPNNDDLTPAEWVACRDQMVAEWGDGLEQFTMSNATDDLADLIERARVPGQDVILYGLSYGTDEMWRLLARHPHAADAVIQDAIVSPGVMFQSREDQYADPVFREYARMCAADPFCHEKLGDDPFSRIVSVSKAVANGHCAASGFDSERLRLVLGDLLVAWNVRVYALSIPYRLERCSEADIVALHKFLAFYFEPYDLDGYSNALDVNISFSEIWEHPSPSPATLIARAEHQVAAIDYGFERAAISATWPRHPADHRDPEWPRIDVPMLMLNGTLDVETPLPTAEVAALHYHGPHQTFVRLPNSPHAGGYQSPTTRPDGLPCGIDIMASFVADPRGMLDTSCIADMEPVRFDDDRFARFFFGTTSTWEN